MLSGGKVGRVCRWFENINEFRINKRIFIKEYKK